jgi:hypothetical protein
MADRTPPRCCTSGRTAAAEGSVVSKPDYEQVLYRLGTIATKVDKAEERARHNVDNALWRQLHFLRLDATDCRTTCAEAKPPERPSTTPPGRGTREWKMRRRLTSAQ